MFAEASNVSAAFMGQWVVAAFSFVGGMGGILAAASYFATRREVERIEQRVTRLEDVTGAIRAEIRQQKDELMLSADRRSSILHNRINPVVENLAALKASNEAFVTAFENHTRVMEALVRRSANERMTNDRMTNDEGSSSIRE
jgi:hypothetical protein